MAKREVSFNFGALAKKTKGTKKARTSKGKGGKGKSGNAWKQYIGNAPIPD